MTMGLEKKLKYLVSSLDLSKHKEAMNSSKSPHPSKPLYGISAYF